MGSRPLVATVVMTVAVLAAALWLSHVWRGRPDGATALASAAPPVRKTVHAPPRFEPPTPVAVRAVTCRSQSLEVVEALPVRHCVTGPLTQQNGGMRSYVIDFDDGSASLRVDGLGQTVLAVTLRNAAGAEFRCGESACGGASIGERDDLGRRVLTLNSPVLTRTETGDLPAGSLRVAGRFTTVPEELLGDVACTRNDEVVITRDNGSHHSFCPRDGAGFEIADDGDRTYRFTSLEGDSILVHVDAGEQLRRVEYLGAVAHECAPPACGSVAISAAEESGERRFSFRGVTVTEIEGGNRTALLDGTLILPPI